MYPHSMGRDCSELAIQQLCQKLMSSRKEKDFERIAEELRATLLDHMRQFSGSFQNPSQSGSKEPPLTASQ